MEFSSLTCHCEITHRVASYILLYNPFQFTVNRLSVIQIFKVLKVKAEYFQGNICPNIVQQNVNVVIIEKFNNKC